LFFVLNIISPEYMQTFYTTTVGKFLIIGAASMVLFGAWVMNKLSVMRF